MHLATYVQIERLKWADHVIRTEDYRNQ